MATSENRSLTFFFYLMSKWNVVLETFFIQERSAAGPAFDRFLASDRLTVVVGRQKLDQPMKPVFQIPFYLRDLNARDESDAIGLIVEQVIVDDVAQNAPVVLKLSAADAAGCR